MLEFIEGMVAVIALIGIGVIIGISTAVYKYYSGSAKIMKKADGMMEPLTKFYSKMLNDDSDLL